MKLTRRQALGLLGTGVAGAMTWHLWPSPAELADERVPSPLTPAQRTAVAAASDRVLPGAVAAGVPVFIDYWLAREPFAEFVLRAFEIGADELDRLAIEGHQGLFAELSPADQDTLLGRFQRGELTLPRFTGRGFFEQLVKFTLEGFLSHPRYGGNCGGVGSEFIGHQHHFWAPPSLGAGAEPKAVQE